MGSLVATGSPVWTETSQSTSVLPNRGNPVWDRGSQSSTKALPGQSLSHSFLIFSFLAFPDESICATGDGIWNACSDLKTLCPDVLIPCGTLLYHTWPPMAWFDKVNDYCGTEVAYAHWSLPCAHKRVPPSLLMQLNAFYLEICTIHVQFSHPPHTTSLH